MTQDLKPPAFSSKGGNLMPCGELKPHDVKVIVTDGICARPVCIWIDEAGLLWDISHSVAAWQLKPLEWPVNIRANYVVGHSSWRARGSMPITADSYEEAKEKVSECLKERNEYADDIKFELKAMSAPWPMPQEKAA